MAVFESGGEQHAPRPARVQAPGLPTVEVETPCRCVLKADWDRGERGMTCEHGSRWVVRAEPVRSVTYTVRADLSAT